MRAETELFKDKIEVSLDGRQIFYLFFGGAVIASLVFVLGVMVGKRVEARAHTDSRPATSAELDPLAALDQLTHDDLAYPAALAGRDVPLGQLDEPEEARAAEPEEARPATPAAKAPGKPADKPRAKAAATERTPATEATGPAAARSSRFTLQLSSFRDRAEADAFQAKLKAAGFAPYVVEAQVPNKGTWYRVRLGHYDSYDAAIAAKQEFEASQHIIAYVTRLSR